MNPVVVAKIYKKRFALYGILAPPTGLITRWTSKNQIFILKKDYVRSILKLYREINIDEMRERTY